MSALDASERSELLGALLRCHPDLREDAERLARERLAGPAPEGLASEVAPALQLRGDFASSRGGRGSRRVDRLQEIRAMVEALGRRAMTVPRDVAEPQDCQRLVDETVRKLGRVNVLVHNAGIGAAVPATRETVEQFGSVIDDNLNGCY
jgi:NAD(P)-dependent dehydrogenase (short-subunit alcohol dehydrogenase family)